MAKKRHQSVDRCHGSGCWLLQAPSVWELVMEELPASQRQSWHSPRHFLYRSGTVTYRREEPAAVVSLHAWHAMDHFLEGSWRRRVEDVGCHVCPESAHGACLPEPMTWLDALEFHGTFIDVPKEVAMPPQPNFRVAARSTGHMTMKKLWMKTS